MPKLAWAALVAVIGLSAGPAFAAGGADKAVIQMGKGLAERLCASCHTVSADQYKRGENPASPQFQDIANRPGVTSQSLEKFLKTTQHRQFIGLSMPNPQLSDDEMTKVLAYILSLRKPAS